MRSTTSSSASFVSPRRVRAIAATAIVSAGVVVATASTTAAQSTPPVPQGDADTTLETLRAELRRLEAELAAAKARIAELEADLAAAKAAQPAQRAVEAPIAPPAQPSLPVLAEGEPATCIEQLLVTLRADYDTRFGRGLEAADDEAKEGEERKPARPETPAARQRAIERWITASNRTWRGPVSWTTKLERSERIGEETRATVQVVDDEGEPLGRPFDIRLDARQTKRFEQLAQRPHPAGAGPHHWTLEGLLSPKLVWNAAKIDGGVFDTPPLVGPGIEFRWDFAVDVFVPKKPAEPAGDAERGGSGGTKDGTTAPPAAPTR
jgi:hypothetical protein